MLSAKELINQSSRNSSLHDPGVPKLFGPEGSAKEEECYENTLKQYSSVLSEERICCRDSLSVAHWNAKDNIAVVDVKKGGSLQKFGYQTKEGKFLKPEETLFLIDQGLLELFYDGLPLSLHEAYILVIPLLPSFEYYEVYAYLCRLGYVITRYQKRDETRVVGSKWGTAPPSPKSEKELIDDGGDGECLEPMASGYVKNLWEGDAGNIPCIKPSEATSTAAVLSKLQVMELLNLRCVEVPESVEQQWRVDFDVYTSQSSKKANLGRPRFRVVVCKYSDPPPSLCDMAYLTKESDGVNLKLAVVNDGSISFYGMFSVDIPTLITLG